MCLKRVKGGLSQFEPNRGVFGAILSKFHELIVFLLISRGCLGTFLIFPLSRFKEKRTRTLAAPSSKDFRRPAPIFVSAILSSSGELFSSLLLFRLVQSSPATVWSFHVGSGPDQPPPEYFPVISPSSNSPLTATSPLSGHLVADYLLPKKTL